LLSFFAVFCLECRVATQNNKKKKTRGKKVFLIWLFILRQQEIVAFSIINWPVKCISWQFSYTNFRKGKFDKNIYMPAPEIYTQHLQLSQ